MPATSTVTGPPVAALACGDVTNGYVASGPNSTVTVACAGVEIVYWATSGLLVAATVPLASLWSEASRGSAAALPPPPQATVPNMYRRMRTTRNFAVRNWDFFLLGFKHDALYTNFGPRQW